LAPALARAEENIDEPQIALLDPGSCIVAASKSEAEARNVVEVPHLIHHAPIPYPIKAMTTHREGWVHMTMTVNKDGSAADAAVAECYPDNLFEQAALERAPTFKFSPGTINGEPRITRRQRFALMFYVKGERGITRENMMYFGKLRRDVMAGKTTEAAESYAALQKEYDRGLFNLTEVARCNEFGARVALQQHNVITANECIRKTIALGQFLDSEEALEYAQKLRVLIYAALGKSDQAVDYYAAVGKKYPKPSAQLDNIVGQLRDKGFGKGVCYEILTQSEMKKLSAARTKDLQKT
jgi:TonB family protein